MAATGTKLHEASETDRDYLLFLWFFLPGYIGKNKLLVLRNKSQRQKSQKHTDIYV